MLLSQWKSGTKVKPFQIFPGRFRALQRQAEQECFVSYLCLPLGNQDTREGMQHTGGTGGKFLPSPEKPTGLGTGDLHCSCVGFLSAITHLELLMAQIPSWGLREAAEEGRVVSEGAETWNPFAGAQRTGIGEILWWQEKNPRFTKETWLRWQQGMKQELQRWL